jgi:hypothetical protein
MTDRSDTDLLKIFTRQARQDLFIDLVIAERLLVSPEIEATKPVSDVHLLIIALRSSSGEFAPPATHDQSPSAALATAGR